MITAEEARARAGQDEQVLLSLKPIFKAIGKAAVLGSYRITRRGALSFRQQQALKRLGYTVSFKNNPTLGGRAVYTNSPGVFAAGVITHSMTIIAWE